MHAAVSVVVVWVYFQPCSELLGLAAGSRCWVSVNTAVQNVVLQGKQSTALAHVSSFMDA